MNSIHESLKTSLEHETTATLQSMYDLNINFYNPDKPVRTYGYVESGELVVVTAREESEIIAVILFERQALGMHTELWH